MKKRPKFRLIFFLQYLVFAIFAANDYIQPMLLKIIAVSTALFGAYLSLVKANIIRDKFAKSIPDDRFDFFSISYLIIFLFDVLKHFIK